MPRRPMTSDQKRALSILIITAVVIVILATEPIEGNASPRNPSVCTRTRSSKDAILLVACRSIAS